MFTGIITDIGEIVSVQAPEAGAAEDRRLTIRTSYDPDGIDIGASIACSGCCLTVIERGRDGAGQGWFLVEASGETLSKTTLGGWGAGRRINLERAAKVGDELGGHVVLGHVDGLGRLVSIAPEGGSHRLVFEAPTELAGFIAPKGSVTIDGISLTVNEVDGTRFGVNIIPHTWTHTTLCDRKPGDAINLEIDVLARYVARLNEWQAGIRG
ncbi:riboflavin synthase [Tistrella mobilis]|uniref:Riboflavin synthase n=1 Tax=Tistrella mobilis (strain KA081020-065) TaxID=1110502 RepID=I3TLM3_TISMK|nr:riboflavin synthase [Tistrella mobilis]AFK53661.1 riboflavin synthase, alpha subunit [Tistrella mobilis KA081020-065]MAM73270.1 riboflavin synthase [Tistrella sp.]